MIKNAFSIKRQKLRYAVRRRHVAESKGQITPIYIITSFPGAGLLRLTPQCAARLDRTKSRVPRGRTCSASLNYVVLKSSAWPI